MAHATGKVILFLCLDHPHHSRFAELVFNTIAGKLGLGYTAASRGVVPEQGGKPHGPFPLAIRQALEQRGIKPADMLSQVPQAVTEADLEQAQRVIFLNEPEALAGLSTDPTRWQEKLDCWPVAAGSEALTQIEERVHGLIARLLGGGERPAAATSVGAPPPARPSKEKPAKALTVKVGRETAGRRGKGVTTVFDVPLSEEELRQLAATLKQRCGTGGTVKDGRIEMQGDLRDRLSTELEKLGYKVKRVGG